MKTRSRYVIGSAAFLAIVFFIISMLGHIAASEAAKTYQYKIVVFEIKIRGQENVLNKMGQEGWRLVEYNSAYAVFER